MEKVKQKVTILLPVELVMHIKEQAKQHQRSFTGEVIWALQTYLERQGQKNKSI